MDKSQKLRLRVLLVDATSTDGASATPGWTSLEAEPSAGGDHRRLPGVDGSDDLGVVDALAINRRDAEVGMPQLALDDIERHPFVGELDGVGVAQLVGREPPPYPGLGGDATELRAGGVARPRPATGPSVNHAQQRSDRHAHARFEPGAEVLPAPAVHADLAAAAALAVTDQYCSETRIKVVLGQGERLVDAQPRPPEEDNRARMRAPWTPPAARITATTSSTAGGSGG
jgi:hypothetical protein